MNFDELKYKTLHSVAYAIATESSVNYLLKNEKNYYFNFNYLFAEFELYP